MVWYLVPAAWKARVGSANREEHEVVQALREGCLMITRMTIVNEGKTYELDEEMSKVWVDALIKAVLVEAVFKPLAWGLAVSAATLVMWRVLG